MQLNLKYIPASVLPYSNVHSVSKFIEKFSAGCPFLPCLPRIDKNDNLLKRTFSGIESILLSDNTYSIIPDLKVFKTANASLDIAFKTMTGIDAYAFESPFLKHYLDIIKKHKPKEAIINFVGPYTSLQILKSEIITQDEISKPLITDAAYRKFIIEVLCLKAFWIANKIKSLSQNTIPIIVLEEPNLNNLGTLRRSNEHVTNKIVTGLYKKIAEKLHEYDIAVGIHSVNKCDWLPIIDAQPDIISYNAYDNPNNLVIIAKNIQKYLESGGYINWGIVPVKDERAMRHLTLDYIYNRFDTAINNLIAKGTGRKLTYERSLVSTSLFDLSNLPVLFAEKGLMFAEKLQDKIPVIK